MLGWVRVRTFFIFLIDHLPRLLLLLEKINEPVVVIHQDTDVEFIEQYLALIEQYFLSELYRVEKNNFSHLKVTSELILISDVSRRLRYSAKQFEAVLQRAKTDPQLKNLGLKFEQLTPKKFEDHQLVHHWIYSDSNQILKQSSSMFEHSKTAIDSLYRFGQLASSENRNGVTEYHDIILVTRDKSKLRQRFLENEQELVSTIGHITSIDFARLSVVEQITVANKCRVMVGVTGAGMANAVYMESGGLVIDIAPLGRYLPAVDMLEELCRARALLYVRVFSSPLDEQGATTVDTGLVERILKENRPDGIPSLRTHVD